MYSVREKFLHTGAGPTEGMCVCPVPPVLKRYTAAPASGDAENNLPVISAPDDGFVSLRIGVALGGEEQDF